MNNEENKTFETLEERMLYYRSKPEQVILKNSYVLIHLDGKNFSKLVKTRFNLPFDEDFINLMNDTAAYVCSKIQGSKFAFVQSDEISIFVSDAEAEDRTLYYKGRMVKMLSVIPSIATSYFNRQVTEYLVKNKYPKWDGNSKYIEPEDRFLTLLNDEPLYQFDCKVWTVPTLTEVWNWFLFRNRDCSKNSRQQAAQTYLKYEDLVNKNTDEQIALLKNFNGIDWHTAYNDGEKYGRFIYKVKEPHTREFNGEIIPYERSVWKAIYGRDLDADGGKEWFWQTLIEPLGFPEIDPIKKTFRDLLEENKVYCEKMLKNLAYLSELNEVVPDAVDVKSEDLLDCHYSNIEKIISETNAIIYNEDLENLDENKSLDKINDK